MRYASTDDLPEPVRGHFPPHAREIYPAAFNNAWRRHARDPDGEAVVYRIARAAVKRSDRNAGDVRVPIGR